MASASSGPLIGAMAPTPDLKPYAFEGHMYGYDASVLTAWAQGSASVGAGAYIGETNQVILPFYTTLHNLGIGTDFYRWSCDSLLVRTTPVNVCWTSPTLASTATQLSQLYVQVWG